MIKMRRIFSIVHFRPFFLACTCVAGVLSPSSTKAVQFVYSFAPDTELAIESNNKSSWKLFLEGSFVIDWNPNLTTPTTGSLISANISTRTTNNSGVGINNATGTDTNGLISWSACPSDPPTTPFTGSCISLNNFLVPSAQFDTFALYFYKDNWWEDGTGAQTWLPKLLVSSQISSPTGFGITNLDGGEWCANDCNGNGNRLDVTGVTEGGVVPSPFSAFALIPMAAIRRFRKRYRRLLDT